MALPFLVTLLTGLLLTTRGYNTWMQPSYQAATSPELKVSFDQILSAVRSVPEARIRSWADVHQIDIRPGIAQIRVRSKFDHWEVQVDGATGAVLQAKKRRVSWITSLHEGAAFGPQIRYGVFFPSALGVLLLTITGLVLFFQPYLRARRRRARNA